MNETFQHYSRDCVYILKEKARDAKREFDRSDAASQQGYRLGLLVAYSTVIYLLQQQARAFQIPLSDLSLDDIDPDRDLLGEPIVRAP